MKKIVALGAIAALACGMVFADEPAIDTKIAEFNGNAEVKWGVDLDAGQHGFTNSTGGNLKVNLWNEGTKETEGDGVWADIQVKGKKGAVENGTPTWGSWSVERAKLHINDFYIDIKEGGTKVGEFKPDTAVHSDYAWLASRGLDFTQGIQAGYDAEAFKFSVDFRSFKSKTTNYTSAYGIKAEAGLKDNLVPGLTVDAGVSYNLSTGYNDLAKDASIEAKVADENKTLADHYSQVITWNDDKGNAFTDQSFGKAEPSEAELAYMKEQLAKVKKTKEDAVKAAKEALEAAEKDAETFDNFNEWKTKNEAVKTAKKALEDAEKAVADLDEAFAEETAPEVLKDAHLFAYGIKAAYKLAIGDDMFIKPSVGFDGTYATGSYKSGKDWKPATESKNELSVGVLFGWGDINKDDKPGVPFLDGDDAKKVSPGVGVVAYIPLPTVSTKDDRKHTEHDALQALIVPSFFLGDGKVEGLKAAAYGEIGLYKFIKDEDQPKASSDGKVTEYYNSVKENETTAIAFAAGLSYGITLDNDWTITPKAGFRYANSAYVANGLEGKYSTIFTKLGMQKAYTGTDGKATFDGDFLNLKAGVELGGAIENVTFSANYTSANLSNGISDDAKSNPNLGKDDYDSTKKYYNIKAGTFDIGCKISL